MVQITEAVFSDGVLKPLGDVALADGQRVRLIVEPIENASVARAPADRALALSKLLAGIEGMRFYSTGPLPSRDDLHDRV
jgi:predicted DNA-binding antitoxin AbrB/MazE fold protein